MFTSSSRLRSSVTRHCRLGNSVRKLTSLQLAVRRPLKSCSRASLPCCSTRSFDTDNEKSKAEKYLEEVRRILKDKPNLPYFSYRSEILKATGIDKPFKQVAVGYVVIIILGIISFFWISNSAAARGRERMIKRRLEKNQQSASLNDD